MTASSRSTEESSAECSFLAHAEERAVRQHDSHASGRGRHRFDHVLNPGVVAALRRRHPSEVTAVWIAGPDFLAPFLQREWRIGDHAVERGEVVAEKKAGLRSVSPRTIWKSLRRAGTDSCERWQRW